MQMRKNELLPPIQPSANLCSSRAAKFSQTFKVVLIAFLSSVLFSATVLANTAAPDFWLSNLERVRFDSREQNSPYVISFFFIGCVPCVKEIPALHEWIASNAPGVELLFISPIKEDSKKDIERYAERLQVPAKYFYSDPFGNVLRKFFPDKAQGVFPTLLGVREGQVQFVRHTLDDITYEELATLSK